MTIKYGLEKEYFVFKPEDLVNPVVCPGSLNPDGCGFLAEARGEPFTNPINAVYSLLADEHRLQGVAIKLGLVLVAMPIFKVSKTVRTAAGRIYQKGLTKYQNLYGYENHKNVGLEHTAGVHVSVTDGAILSYVNKNDQLVERKYNANFDWPRLFTGMDRTFKLDIKEAKRLPGFYELKDDGRVEYRSLPNNVDLMRLADYLHAFRW
jgi:hypothetical protein